MLYVIQIFIVTILILNLIFNIKVKLEKNNRLYISIGLIFVNLISNIFLNFIPYPTTEVKIAALGDKNELALNSEIKITNLEIDGDKLTEFDLNEGKWMRSGDDYYNWGKEYDYYMWRNQNDSRQPNGLTNEIKFDIPFGLDRFIVFKSEKWSGLVQIDDGTLIQIVDLYNEDNSKKKVAITPSTSDEMNRTFFYRFIAWFFIFIFLFFIFLFLQFIITKIPKTKDFIILSIILLTQVLVMIYYGNEKTGFHVDEVWSYEIANKSSNFPESYSVATSDSFFDTWHNKSVFYDILTITDGQKIDYSEPYKIISNDDVHPPLYYYLMRTFSTIFPNTFSKWIGIVLNLIIFVLSSIVLYKISKNLIENKKLILLPLFFWGFSVGTISSIIFIRMYVLLTFAILVFVYCYLNYVYNKNIELNNSIIIFLATYLGCVTQYYFLIFAFFFTLYECLKRLLNKDYKNMLMFGSSVLFGVIMLVLTFPASLNHIFNGSRGVQAWNNLEITDNIIINLEKYINILKVHVLGDIIGEFIINVSSSILIIYFFNKFICKVTLQNIQDRGIKLTFKLFPMKEILIPYYLFTSKITPILISTIAFIYIIAWIAPYQTDRYIFCIYPIVSLLFIIYLDKLFILINLRHKNLLLLFIIFIINSYSLKNVVPNYLYPSYENTHYYAEENKELKAIYIFDENSTTQVSISLPYFLNYESVFITKDLDKLVPSFADKKETENIDKIIVYINNASKIEQSEYIDELKKLLGYRTHEILDSDVNTMYRLSNLIK